MSTKQEIGTAVIIMIFLAVCVTGLFFLGLGIMNPSPHTVCKTEYGQQSKWDFDLKRCIDGMEPKMSRREP